jgi:3-dehydroquinate dehydratase-2
MKKIGIINGPNLNLIGLREPEIYGSVSLDKYLESLKIMFGKRSEITYFQSNVEGEMIDALHQMGFSYDGIIINAGGYSHTSIALADAIKAIPSRVICVHISNTFKRGGERSADLVAAASDGIIIGFGLDSYRLAMNYLLD